MKPNFNHGSPARIEGKQELILLRGIPGAGKTTFGRLLQAQAGCYFFEADQWRGEGDERIYDYNFNPHAHAWCLGKTADSLRMGYNVAVANVFCERIKLKPYFRLAADLNKRGHKIKVTVLNVEGPKEGRSIHDKVNYQRYREAWEEYSGEYQLD